MLIISCSKGVHIGSKIASKLKASHSKLFVEEFPDGELYIKYNTDLKNKKVVLVQSFYGNIQECLVEVVFAAQTAKDLGAKKVILVAPYMPYFRQDKRFKPGECVSIKAMASLIDKYFDGLLVFDPHLHREKVLKHIFKTKAVKLSANKRIAAYIKRNFKKPVLIGPDSESYKWARFVAEMINAESHIYSKKRYSARKVKVGLKDKLKIKGRNIVIVDDMISTGRTILETAKDLSKHKPKSISCICVHGIFVGHILKLFKHKKIRVISTNTIPSSRSKIDVSKDVVEVLKSF